MLTSLGPTQQKLLRLLLNSADGLTFDEIADDLKISRNAVDQHMTSLNDYVRTAGVRETRGRPSRRYCLSNAGRDLFPKQYSWFSEVLLGAIKGEQGASGLSSFLKTVARSVAKQISLKGNSLEEKLPEVVSVMQSLHYEARVATDSPRALEARNCVYHHLAKEHPEVCDFDTELLESLLTAKVNHEECMLKGSAKCRFSFTPKAES